MKHNTATPWPQQTTQELPPGAELSTEIPARPASLAADLAVPLGQALVTGALLGAVLAWLLSEVSGLVGVEPPEWWRLWGGLALGICCMTWLILLGQHRRLLWAIERMSGFDLDGDGQAGDPQERLVIVNAGQAREEAGRHEDAQRRSQFARFVSELTVRGTSARTWEKELGRDTYQEFRDALIRLGWARWNSTKRDGSPNTKRGWALTLPAADILGRID